jgi:Raf kinase inhibitor-like YbhB/YbcL family protein
MSARYAYALIGFAFILLIGGAWYFSKSAQQKSLEDRTALETHTMSLILSSSAFASNAAIPSKYTCDESQISPPLSIANAPAGTKSFALIVEDPDVPKQLKPDGVFLHWVVFNVPGDTREILEGVPMGVFGANGAGKASYIGPCPPKEYEPTQHRYVFTAYALDSVLGLKSGAPKGDVLREMEGHVIGQAQLIGTYKKK